MDRLTIEVKRSTYSAFVIFAALSVAACSLFYSGSQHPEHAWGYNLTSPPYAVSADRVTPKGVRYDPTGQSINPARIDRLVDEVEACLAQSIERSAFDVKIASDWRMNCDNTMQVLPAKGAGSGGCEAKGLTPTELCPCLWRSYIQPPRTIVTTPSMYLFRDALTRWATGSMNPWAIPRLAKCANPSTGPLDTGVEP